uniref:Arylacetamide deacetylase-like 4 n=1 Tax=Urocitellus parryii TaxID=9999 RepID=A0A8D2GZV4_UROPR
MVPLLETLLVAASILSLGVSLWILREPLLAFDIPPAMRHPRRFWILHCLMQLTFTWGYILEKLGICSMPRFVRFLQDRLTIKNNREVVVTDLRFGTIPVRLFQPKAVSSSLRRGILFYHGGGSLLGSLASSDTRVTRAHRRVLVPLLLRYRKAPEHHYPVAVTDCINASIHFLKTLEAYGVDPSRVVACGESFGGGAVALITQILVGRTDLPQIRAQVLIYPVMQAINLQLPSFQQNQNVPFLSLQFMMTCVCSYLAIDLSWKDAMMKGACIPRDFWKKHRKWLSSDNLPKRFRSKDQPPETLAPFNEDAYLETKQMLDVDNAPLIAEDKIIAQLPEAFLVSCEVDMVRDDSLLYKKRLEDQGVRVTWYHVEDGFHGCLFLFDNMFLSFPCSLNIVNAVVNYIKGL